MISKVLSSLSLSLLLSGISANAQSIVGLTNAGQLVTFNATTPGTVSTGVAITNLFPGQTIVGMDFRPNTGELFALGYNSALPINNARLYVINYTTGVATSVSTDITLTLGTGNIGFDFNPAVDRIRVTSTNGMNYRLNPVTGQIVSPDGSLNYAVGDPNNGQTPTIGTSAYTNSYIGSESTVLYGIDESLNILVSQNPPNTGTLNTIGATGLTFNTTDATVDLDIFTDPVTNVNTAYLAANTNAGPAENLYTVNLNTGTATLLGVIGTGNTSLRDIAVVINRNTPTQTGNTIFALTRTNRNLITFDSDNPGYIRSITTLTGLGIGQQIVGMDVRPLTLQLYGLGYNSGNGDYQLYIIDTVTGTLVPVGLVGNLPLGTSNVGFDFNPVVDRIRVVASNGANYRLDPTTGIATMDANLSYDANDVAAGNVPNVSGVAYTNSYVGTSSTSLFGIDDNLGSLITIPVPNSGVLNTISVGVYTFNPSDLTTDIDFFFDSTNSGANVGYLAANIGTSNADQFYEMTVIGNPVWVGGIGMGIGVLDIASKLLYTGTTNLSLLGVANVTNKNSISIFPNPATDMISISLPSNSGEAQLIISDMTGKTLIHQTLTTQPISVSALPAGMYIVSVRENGVNYAPAKLIKR